MEGQLFPALSPRLSALEPAQRKGECLASGDVRCLGEGGEPGKGRRGPSLAVEQVSAATCRWAEGA